MARPAKAPGTPTMPSKAIQPGRPSARNIRYKPQAQSTKPAQAKSCVAPLPGGRPGCRVPTMPMLAKPCGISASRPRTARVNPELYIGATPISEDTGLNPHASKYNSPPSRAAGVWNSSPAKAGACSLKPCRSGQGSLLPTPPHHIRAPGQPCAEADENQ